MTDPSSAVKAVALAPDLMDASKLRGAGVEVVRRLDSPPTGADLVIIDLDRADVPADIDSWPCRTVGFGRHTDPERLEAALAAGLDDAMPRSVFFKRLADGLAAL